MERYALALVLTIVIETGLAGLLRRRAWRRLRVDVPLMNLLTHPLLHLGFARGLPLGLGELLVMAVESAIYRKVTGLSLGWALLLGIGLNAITWGLGVVLFQVL